MYSSFKALAQIFPVGLATLFVLGATGCASLFTDTARDEEKAVIHLKSATELLAQRRYNEALEACQKAVDLAPEMAAAHNHLALVFMETKRYDKSEESFKKALELSPNYPEALNNLGVLLNRRERFREAVVHFERALKSETYATPENAYTNLGFSFFKLGNTAKAKEFHQRALDVAPQFCLATKNLGDVYAKEKDYKRASEHFEKSITNCPLYQESEYKLGLALMKLGHRSIARSHFERLIEKHKSGPYVERSTEVLKYLR